MDFILPSGTKAKLSEEGDGLFFAAGTLASPLLTPYEQKTTHFFPQSARIRTVIELGATLVGIEVDSISAIQDQGLDVVIEAGSTYQKNPEVATDILVREHYKARKTDTDPLDGLCLLDCPKTIPMKPQRQHFYPDLDTCYAERIVETHRNGGRAGPKQHPIKRVLKAFGGCLYLEPPDPCAMYWDIRYMFRRARKVS